MEADLRRHLQPLLGKITSTPAQRGTVVLVTSHEAGAGRSSVARSLNAAAIDRGMLSVLIEIAAEPATAAQRRSPPEYSVPNRGRALNTTAASLTQLLPDNRNLQTPAMAGDVRSEFDLIVIDAPALQRQTDVAAMAARADFAIVVVTEATANAGFLRGAEAALSRSGARLGIVINKMNAVPASSADQINPDRKAARNSSFA
jgi:Mrp family chromosome partitioning ATPase